MLIFLDDWTNEIPDWYGHLRGTILNFHMDLSSSTLVRSCYLSSLLLFFHLILFVRMHMCRPHGDNEGIRFGSLEVLFQCVSLCTLLLCHFGTCTAIWISSGTEGREFCNHSWNLLWPLLMWRGFHGFALDCSLLFLLVVVGSF